MAKKFSKMQATTPARNQPAAEVTPFTPGELPRRSDVEPVSIRSIVKLDQRSMVWAYEGVATEVEALGPFLALFFSTLTPFGFWFGYLFLFVFGNEGGPSYVRIPLAFISFLVSLGLIALIAYLLKISIFSRYSDLHFNRASGEIYSRENNTALRMDWDNVRPYAQLGFGPPQLGGAPLMSLMLIEYYPNQPQTWKSRMTVAGPLPNRNGCQQVWEMIRRYMEDAPEKMPEIEVVPGGRNWVSALIEFGPLTGHLMTVPKMMTKLRKRNWWPPINPLNVIWWIGAWPSPLSTTLYARYRPKAKLPAEWTNDETPLLGEPNPYRTAMRDPLEAAGRRKAALVTGITCGVCILIGMTLWGAGLYPLFNAIFGNG